MSSPSTITSVASTPSVSETTTTIPAPLAQPTDLKGTLSLATTTLFADVSTAATLTLTNVSDHPVSVSTSYTSRNLGIWIGYYDYTVFNLAPDQATLNPGQQRTFATTISGDIALAGGARVSAAIISQIPAEDVASPLLLPGVPSIPVTIVPPGTAPGQPLDPVFGHWKVEMSANKTQVARGNGVIVHAN